MRVASKLSRAKLGEVMGTSEWTVLRWERGEGEPSFSAMLNLWIVTSRRTAFEKFAVSLTEEVKGEDV